MPTAPPASQLAACLFELSHAQLLEVAVAVEGVLLSSDLVPLVLASLQLEDGAAAAVCSLWAEGWKATSEGRRRLTRVAFDFPPELLVDLNDMAVIPGADEQLVVSSGHTIRILDRSMSTVTSFTGDDRLTTITTDEQSIYATAFSAFHLRLTHNGTEVACHEDPDGYAGYCPVRAPGGLLFCVRYKEADAYEQDDANYDQDEIVALDAHSLQPRYRFGKSLLNDARGLAVVGEELFVCDMKNNRLQVFSLAGEHRRSITGEWKRPASLCVVKDRVYLIESCDIADDDPLNEIQTRGRRIFVLSLQGDTLQVYPIPIEGKSFSGSLIYFDGKLLVPYTDYRCAHVGIVALRCT